MYYKVLYHNFMQNTMLYNNNIILYIYPQQIRFNTNNIIRVAAPNFNNFHSIDLLYHINNI